MHTLIVAGLPFVTHQRSSHCIQSGRSWRKFGRRWAARSGICAHGGGNRVGNDGSDLCRFAPTGRPAGCRLVDRRSRDRGYHPAGHLSPSSRTSLAPPRQAVAETTDYKHRGTTTSFSALNLLRGTVVGLRKPPHCQRIHRTVI